MARLLERVASEQGGAPVAAIPGYEVAGKTGTAQKVNPDGRGYSEHHHVSSFVGFLPADNPQIVISVIVDDADAHTPGGVAFGRIVAAPSFKHLGEQLISYLDIRPPLTRSSAAILALEGSRR
jgi:cell division protein FtsI/penicillin-binding protein 2